MLGLLSCLKPELKTVPIISPSDEDVVEIAPTVYTYTASRVGDDSATEAMFNVLSCDYMAEFRY